MQIFLFKTPGAKIFFSYLRMLPKIFAQNFALLEKRNAPVMLTVFSTAPTTYLPYTPFLS